MKDAGGFCVAARVIWADRGLHFLLCKQKILRGVRRAENGNRRMRFSVFLWQAYHSYIRMVYSEKIAAFLGTP